MERLKAELVECEAARDDFFDSCDCYAKRIRELEAQAKGLTTETRDRPLGASEANRVLAALGVGKQSAQYKRVKAVLDKLIGEVKGDD